jgi:AcrR family transcriptional regulator
MLASMTSPSSSRKSSEREPDDVRRRLLEAAALLLDEGGPDSLTARRLATEARTSTMAVYTHFGGMQALVREIVVEGFRRFAAHVTDQPRTDDPVADLTQMAFAYRENALENPHLYSVMFGATSLGGYRLTPEEREVGRYTFVVLADAVERAMDAGRLRRDDPSVVAEQLWSAMHGFVMLELAGLHPVSRNPPEDVLRPLMNALLAGLSVPE